MVDLDGTIIHTDMLHESAIGLLRKAPWQIVYIPLWLMQGKARLKDALSSRTVFNPASLPYNGALMDWLKEQKSLGRTLILCTAAEQTIAHAIASYLGYFDEVIATDASNNLKGECKATLLEERFGIEGFDYIGNSYEDLPVWKRARRAIVVNASKSLVKKAASYCEIERVFPTSALDIKAGLQILRPHQWIKNLLIFVPTIAAHQLSQFGIWLSLLFAFLSFNACASAVYIANDLLDLENDRLHPQKSKRPFASGRVPIRWGVCLVPLLVLLSLCLGALVNTAFLSWLMFYFLITQAYSFWLKRLVLIDCLILAMLYTLRMMAGAAAVNLNVTFWLLGFSVFLFLSLAFIKRSAELFQTDQKGQPHGRGYVKSDLPIIQMLGVASGYAAVIVLAFYLNSDVVMQLYHRRECVWAAVPIMLFWINWIWICAHRGLIQDDPVIFAIKDKVSLCAGMLFATALCLGTIGGF